MKRLLLVHSSLALFGMVVAFLICECALRVLGSDTAHASKLDRPLSDYSARTRLNRFRDVYHGHEKPPGVFRILNVGDSFTYAGKVLFQDSYSSKLEQFLNQNLEAAPRFELVKAAIPGLNIGREARLAESMAKRFHPDLILVQLFLNDAESVPFKYSHYGRVVRALDSLVESSSVKMCRSLEFVLRRARQYVSHYETVAYYKSLYDDPIRWRAFKQAAKSFRLVAQKHNAALAFVLFPSLGASLEEGSYPFGGIHDQIAGFMEKRRFSYLDLMTSFQGMDEYRLQAIPGLDSHPNEIAHRIAAESIYKFLQDEKLIPDSR